MNVGSENLPPWSQCDAFCINAYSGAGSPACGWRGRLRETQRGKDHKLLCPRCRCATVMPIPLDPSDEG